jgi:hypothetical protein
MGKSGWRGFALARGERRGPRFGAGIVAVTARAVKMTTEAC